MKVLFAIKFLSLQGGGAERVLCQIASALAMAGHEVVVASYDRGDATDFYDLDPSVHRIRLNQGEPRAASIKDTLKRVLSLRRAVVACAPDVAVGFMHSVYLPLRFALLGTGIRVIASEHMTWDQYRTVPVQAAMVRTAASLFSAITVPSEPVKGRFPPAMMKRMAVISNPVTCGVRSEAGHIGSERRTLLSIGRMRDEKDFPTLVAAFSLLADDFPEWDLRIVGDGAGRIELEERILSLGLTARVALPGALQDVSAELSRADLYVNSSRYESFGLSTAEALAHGVPAVGFADCPGTNDLIEDGVNGVLAGSGPRPLALATALTAVMGSEALRLQLAAAAADSVAQYALGPIADRWEDLLTRVATHV